MVRFYTVQSVEDAARLSAGGIPWPTGLQRANLGPGLYAWGTREDAESYHQVLLEHGVGPCRILVYELQEDDLHNMKKLDLTLMSDEEVTAWLANFSHYGAARPHEWEYVVRATARGKEHFFAASAFARLKEVQ